ncbi:MAG: hypothetical protein PWP49_1535, partial [Thermococcaceae archaeon]|nr:hypothetical protein [Thermococcaceae archaeon]
VFESVIPSGDHDNHLKEFSKNPNKGYYKHAQHHRKIYKSTYVPYDWVRAAVA